MDIEEAGSYGVCDKSALRCLQDIRTLVAPGIIFFPGFRKLMTSYNKIVVILLVGGMIMGGFPR